VLREVDNLGFDRGVAGREQRFGVAQRVCRVAPQLGACHVERGADEPAGRHERARVLRHAHEADLVLGPQQVLHVGKRLLGGGRRVDGDEYAGWQSEGRVGGGDGVHGGRPAKG
jgi:hypothetical protein